MAPKILFILLAAYSQPVLIFLPGGKAAPDVTLGFVHIQHHPGPGGKRRVDALQPLCYILMYR